MANLLIKFSDGRHEKRELHDGEHVVGRHDGCDIVVEDPGTSRRHTKLSPSAAGWVVEDMGSKNGTLVNGMPITSRLLCDRDIITIGAVELEFRDLHVTSTHCVVVKDDDRVSSRATRYIGKDQELLLSQRRLELIYKLGGRLTKVRDDKVKFLEDALAICCEMLGFERGAIAIRRSERRGVDWPVVHNLYGDEGELTVSGSLLRRAMEHGERAIFTDTAKFDPTVSMVELGIRSAMCVPLMHGEQILGVIYGDQLRSSTAYTQEDIDFLAAIAGQVTIGLINHRLLDEHKKLARLEHDVDLARRIQTGLFPRELPVGASIEVAALNDPGNRVSGDYYDVVALEDGRFWLLIADVTGEGAAAALLMANLQAAARATIHLWNDPGAALTHWNRLICENTDTGKFITCLLALVDPEKRSFQLSSAGHPFPFVFCDDDDAPTEVELTPGFPLGVVDSAEYEYSEYIAKGPVMYMAYTDGVTEAANPEGEMFGRDNALERFGKCSRTAPREVVDCMRGAVADFSGTAPQGDDITVLAARVG